MAAAMVEMRCARGEKPVGRKIGFTNRNIWARIRRDFADLGARLRQHASCMQKTTTL